MIEWRSSLVGRLGLRAHDGEDAVQEAFERIVAEWASFSPTPRCPSARTGAAGSPATCGRQTAGRRIRDRRRSIQSRELPADRSDQDSAVTSHETRVSAREIVRSLQCTTSPDRWRAWIAHEVDGVPVAEIARQEGRPRASIYNNLLRLARQDFAAAMARDAVAERNPIQRRGKRRA
jgi:DNA-directed RNA polymerase specialized sigma24 family protein